MDMQAYTQNMQKYAKNILTICKIYAEYMLNICKNMQEYANNMHKYAMIVKYAYIS